MSAHFSAPPDRHTRGLLARLIGDRSLNTKILLIISVMTAVAGTVGVLSINRMSQLNDEITQVYESGLLPVQRIDKVLLTIAEARRTVVNHALAMSDEDKDTYDETIRKLDDQLTADLDAYAANSVVPELVPQVREAWASYAKVRDEQMLPASRRDDMAGFSKLRDEVAAPHARKAAEVAQQIADAESAGAKRRLDNARAAYSSARTTTIVVLVAGVLIALVFGLYIARTIVEAVRKVGHVAEGLAEGDLTRSAGVRQRDEVGRMAGQLDTATHRLREAIGRIGGNSETLAGAAQELSTVSTQIAGSADEVSGRAGAVAAAAEQVSRNVETVSAGAEEMGASIREIANNATDAAKVAQTAVEVAESANATVTKLGESSGEIGNVVKLITSIAEQTNLLALNATIEAARAGELGKGFAVVASEVKDLAQATSRATEDISGKIGAIQGDAQAAVEAIRRIAQVIDKIDGYSSTIASAVEEQTATTSEISRNVAEAASGTTEIAQNVTNVATAAGATSLGVGESRKAAEQLAQMSSELQQLVAGFRI
ncbi:methyl-accepting chemotaxis protein [Micromonospora pattaloongensis]|uniref:Methyl-accepting chemotaxis protein n=1 Tax=Micromonospora pattaloongensis TaxID=405436 RepID=A0A1H3SIR9_9ACTN|nr:methyl-accepting chemotaxis protein [Micromonospora pattaloongensis]SDZ37834.1 methyl-accepting chemotaxis protein [Micromonospora pattaloongensis]